jgi:hypothetical protein
MRKLFSLQSIFRATLVVAGLWTGSTAVSMAQESRDAYIDVDGSKLPGDRPDLVISSIAQLLQ